MNKKKIPSIKLKPLEFKGIVDTGINTKTQQEFNMLLQVCNLGGWLNIEKYKLKNMYEKWSTFSNRTIIDIGANYPRERCYMYRIHGGYNITAANIKILSTEEFNEYQNISSNTLSDIKDYFRSRDLYDTFRHKLSNTKLSWINNLIGAIDVEKVNENE